MAQEPRGRQQVDKLEENEQIEGFNPMSPGSEMGEAAGGVASDPGSVGNIGGVGSAAQAGDVGIGAGDMLGQPTAGAGHGTLADMNARGAGTEPGGGLGEAAGGPGEMTGGSGAGPAGTGVSGVGDARMRGEGGLLDTGEGMDNPGSSTEWQSPGA